LLLTIGYQRARAEYRAARDRESRRESVSWSTVPDGVGAIWARGSRRVRLQASVAIELRPARNWAENFLVISRRAQTAIVAQRRRESTSSLDQVPYGFALLFQPAAIVKTLPPTRRDIEFDSHFPRTTLS
jgi:hypothetical protein